VDNPFDDLRKKRKAEELAKSQIAAAHKNIADKYGDLIAEVLTQLRDAFYPDSIVRGPNPDLFYTLATFDLPSGAQAYMSREKLQFAGIWTLNESLYKSRATISVAALVDGQFRPYRLLCWKQPAIGEASSNRLFWADFNRVELIQILRELHQ
jgi:hypothetical protein